MSDPKAATAIPVATATADPPLLPPGTLVECQGFKVGPNAEFSLEEPIANSSMFVVPITKASSSFKAFTTVASYGE